MFRLKIKWVFFTSLCILSLLSAAGCTGKPYDCSGYYQYHLIVETEHPIENVTFLLPLPEKDNVPKVGKQILDEKQFNDYYLYDAYYQPDDTAPYKVSPDPSQDPSDYRYSIVRISNRSFLQFTANRLIPEKPVSRSISSTVRSTPPYTFVNTQEPVGNESVFYPKSNLTLEWITLYQNLPAHPDLVQYPQGLIQISYDTRIFTDFFSENSSNRIRIFSSVKGENRWSEGFDWMPNNIYYDAYSLDLTGESHGWYRAEGAVDTGKGIYSTLCSQETTSPKCRCI